jgi:hypothetical protein
VPHVTHNQRLCIAPSTSSTSRQQGLNYKFWTSTNVYTRERSCGISINVAGAPQLAAAERGIPLMRHIHSATPPSEPDVWQYQFIPFSSDLHSSKNRSRSRQQSHYNRYQLRVHTPATFICGLQSAYANRDLDLSGCTLWDAKVPQEGFPHQPLNRWNLFEAPRQRRI